jgi:nucleoid-associated protein YgaU
VIAGRAEPGASVLVLDGQRELGRVVADGRGEWVLIPVAALAPGTREISLVARLARDGGELRSERVVVLAVPERGESAGGALAVAVPREGQEPSRLLQVPSAKAAPAMSLALETVDYDGAGNVVLGGRAAPGTSLQIYVDGRAIGRAQADGEGRWQLIPEIQIAPGVYTLRVDQLGADGRVASRVEVPFSRAEPSADLAASGSDRVVVQPGHSLWRIARRVYGQGLRYTVIYEANRASIRDPDRIYPGQIFSLPQN